MTALHDAVVTMPEQRLPLPDEIVVAQPPPQPVAAPSRSALTRWALPATAAALMLVMAATTAVALSRADERADRLATTRGELAVTRTTLADTETRLDSTKQDLDAERLSLAEIRSDLTSSRAAAVGLRSCVDSLMTFIGAIANGDISAATTALEMSNCDDVIKAGAGVSSDV